VFNISDMKIALYIILVAIAIIAVQVIPGIIFIHYFMSLVTL